MQDTRSQSRGVTEHDGGPAVRIVEVATELFARNGFEGVSMNAIAEAAGTSKANVFHHFGCKHDLYLAVMRHVSGRSREVLQELVSDSAEVAERLRHFAEHHLQSLLDQHRSSWLLLRDLVGQEADEERKDLASEAFSENFSLLVRIIQEGQDQGVLRRSANPAMVATLLVAADVFFLISRDMLARYPEVDFADDPARYTELLLDILMSGVLDRDEKS